MYVNIKKVNEEDYTSISITTENELNICLEYICSEREEYLDNNIKAMVTIVSLGIPKSTFSITDNNFNLENIRNIMFDCFMKEKDYI